MFETNEFVCVDFIAMTYLHHYSMSTYWSHVSDRITLETRAVRYFNVLVDCFCVTCELGFSN